MKLDKFELRREIFHLLVGISIIIGVIYIPYAQFIGFGILIIGAFLSFLSTQYQIPLISKSLCLFERECNKNFPGKGVLFFFIGSLISLQIFEKNVALASILILTFADPVSHFIGSNFGKYKTELNKKKNLEGTFSGIIIGTLFASFFISPLVAFFGSFFAMILELAGIAMGNTQIDDNLIIPLVAGTVMHIIIGI